MIFNILFKALNLKFFIYFGIQQIIFIDNYLYIITYLLYI